MKHYHLLIHIGHQNREGVVELLERALEKIKGGRDSGTEYDEIFLPCSYWGMYETEDKEDIKNRFAKDSQEGGDEVQDFTQDRP